MKLKQAVFVGLLFFGSLLMIGFFTVVSEQGPFVTRGRNIIVVFDNAEGIKVGSAVSVIGVPGGFVSAIDLVPVDKYKRIVAPNSPERVGERVAITLELKRDLVFYENYDIAIRNVSLLGSKVVTVFPGTAIPKEEESMEVLREDIMRREPIPVFSKEAGGFMDESTLEDFLQQRDEKNFTELQGTSSGDALGNLSELIAENRAALRNTMDNLNEITAKINKGGGTLGRLINSDELHRNANRLLTDAQIVMREIREGLEDTREQAPVNSFIRAALSFF